MPLTEMLRERLPSLTWGECWPRRYSLILLTAGYGATAVLLYLASGLGQWSPSFSPVGRTVALTVGFFFIPAVVEEIFWRGMLISPTCLGKFDKKTIVSLLVTTTLATIAHPLAAIFFLPHAQEVFLNPVFLLIVFLLGLTCGVAYVLSKSIWPSVLIHWITVLAWKFLLGGPFVLLGR